MRIAPFLRSTILVGALVALSACATSHVLTGAPRAPIDPAQVRIYYGPPPGGYQEIALLEVGSGALTYGAQNKTDSVIAKLRTEAARLGANGVLFQGTADAYGGGSGVSIGAGGGRVSGRGGHFSTSGVGVGVNVSPRQKFGKGIAIFVPNPPPIDPPPPR